jgi:hypothetical protein
MNAWQIDRWDQSFRFEKGVFQMRGCDPDRTYRVFFMQPELHLGAAVDLKHGAGPAEVRLEPTAAVRGKVVGRGDSPDPRAQVRARLLTTKEEGKLEPFDWFSTSDRIIHYSDLTHGAWDAGKPDAEGRFRLENLIPGTQLYIEAGAGPLVARRPVILGPGEVKEIGTLKPDHQDLP